MNKHSIQAQVKLRLADGHSKTETFQRLSGLGVKDSALAQMIASYASPAHCQKYRGLTGAMVGIAWMQLLLAVGILLLLTAEQGSLVLFVLSALGAAFGYLFVWGFRHSRLWAYNISLITGILNISKIVNDFDASPLGNTIGAVIACVLLAFTLHVRGKLFPDVFLWGPRKMNGVYQFSS